MTIENNHKRYLAHIPKQPPPSGTVVVHNHVIPQPVIGVNGFRAWTQDLDAEHLEVCGCDWAPLLERHYRVRLDDDD